MSCLLQASPFTLQFNKSLSVVICGWRPCPERRRRVSINAHKLSKNTKFGASISAAADRTLDRDVE